MKKQKHYSALMASKKIGCSASCVSRYLNEFSDYIKWHKEDVPDIATGAFRYRIPESELEKLEFCYDLERAERADDEIRSELSMFYGRVTALPDLFRTKTTQEVWCEFHKAHEPLGNFDMIEGTEKPQYSCRVGQSVQDTMLQSALQGVLFVKTDDTAVIVGEEKAEPSLVSNINIFRKEIMEAIDRRAEGAGIVYLPISVDSDLIIKGLASYFTKEHEKREKRKEKELEEVLQREVEQLEIFLAEQYGHESYKEKTRVMVDRFPHKAFNLQQVLNRFHTNIRHGYSCVGIELGACGSDQGMIHSGIDFMLDEE